MAGSIDAKGVRRSVVKQILWILLLCPAAGAVACPTGQPKNQAALVEIEKTWARALEEHDINALNCILADEFEDADAQGKLADRSAVIAKAATSRAVHHELSDLHAHIYGDVAYIRGMADATDTQTKAITKVRFTDIYVYREGRWQCVAGHESLVSAISH